jgi:hypothetical protein
MVLLTRACALVFIAGVLATLPSACVANESSLVARACIAPDPTTGEVEFSPTSTFISSGVLDTAFRFEYVCQMLAVDQLVARGDPNKLRTETSRIVLQWADVQLLDKDDRVITRSDGSAAEFSVAINGFIDPGTGNTPGYGGASVLLVDAATAKDLKTEALRTCLVQRVTASVVLRGRTTGGLDLTSNEFRYPIEVGYNNLCSIPADGSACDDTSGTPPANAFPGQDAPVDCRLLGGSCVELMPACDAGSCVGVGASYQCIDAGTSGQRCVCTG